MALRELLLQLGVDVDEKGVKKADNAIAGLKKAAIALAAVFVTGKLAQGIGKILELGSSAAETSNVIEAVFEKNADAVEEWAKRQSVALGRSRFELREMAASTGAIIGPTLKSADAAAKMATQVAQLAVDLGSFFNANDADALTALQAALIGSSEPMLKFGVTMNVATLEAFALEKGISTAFRKMNAAQQQQLRFNFIMEKTVKAQGDAAKTSAGFANATKALRAAAKDALTVIGLKMLPTFEKLLAVLIPLTKKVGTGLVVAFDALGAAIGGVINIADALIGTFNELDNVYDKITVSIGALGFAYLVLGRKAFTAGLKAAAGFIITAAPIILIAALIAILLLVIEDFIVFMKGGDSVIGRLVDRFRKWIDEFGGIGGLIKKIFSKVFQFILDAAKGFIAEVIEDFIRIGESISEAFLELGEFIGENLAISFLAVKKFATDFKDAIVGAIDFVIGKFEALTDAIADAFGAVAEFVGLGDDAPSDADIRRADEKNLKKRTDRIKDAAENRVRILRQLEKEGFGTFVGATETAVGQRKAQLTGATAGAQERLAQLQQNINAPLTVNVNASGQTNPSAIADAIATKIVRTQSNRQIAQSFQTAK